MRLCGQPLKKLPVCPYDSQASGCTRKNPAHFLEYAHPVREKEQRTVLEAIASAGVCV